MPRRHLLRLVLAVSALAAALGLLAGLQGRTPLSGGVERTPIQVEGAQLEDPGSVGVMDATATTGVRSSAGPAALAEPPGSAVTRVRVCVVDPEGRGLPGVAVRVAIPGSWGSFRDLRVAGTDAAGWAAFEGYEPGPLWAEVDPRSLTGGRAAPVRAQGVLTREAPLELTLVCPGTGTVEGQVLGRYSDARRLGRVHAQHVDAAWPSRSVDLDAAGHFRFEGLYEGQWSLWLRPLDRRTFHGLVLGGPREVEVLPGTVVRADLGTETSGQLLRGRVLDQDARGLAGLLVRADQPAEVKGDYVCQFKGDGRAFAITDEAGAYELGPLPAGRYVVQVGDRHGSSAVTRDAVLLQTWPEPFFAHTADNTEHITTVERVLDTVAWRITLDSPQVPAAALNAEIGWCRLYRDPVGDWCFVTARTLRSFTLTVRGAGQEWRHKLETPADAVEVRRSITLGQR